MTEQNGKKSYDKAFKLKATQEAIALRHNKKTWPEVSEALGIPIPTISRWVSASFDDEEHSRMAIESELWERKRDLEERMQAGDLPHDSWDRKNRMLMSVLKQITELNALDIRVQKRVQARLTERQSVIMKHIKRASTKEEFSRYLEIVNMALEHEAQLNGERHNARKFESSIDDE